MNYNLKKINFFCVAVMRAVVAAVVISSFGAGYAKSTAPALPPTPPIQYFENIARTAGEGESEIVLYLRTRHKFKISVGVFVDAQEYRMPLRGGEYGTVVVPNGTHIISVNFFPYRRSNVLTVDVAEKRIVLVLVEERVTVLTHINLVKYADISLKGFPVPPPLDKPKELPPKPTIASSDKDLPKIAVYVTGNVADGEKDALGTRMLASLINSGRYIAIERSNAFLAEIEKEHITQRSGAVDDSQISELGKQFGVKFVCIAAITPAFGEFQVSARIVDVETAHVVFIGESASPLKSMADLARVSDKIVENMFQKDNDKNKGE